MPVPLAAGVAVLNALPSIGRAFGPSEEFQKAQALSDDFFALRDHIFGLVPYMTPQQRAEWESLPHMKVDYNSRRENEYERKALSDFVAKLEREGLGGGASASDGRSLGYVPDPAGVKAALGFGDPGAAGGSLLPVVAVALFGVLAWGLFR
jgi:hypothetical protein